jgi:hypothetical protein
MSFGAVRFATSLVLMATVTITIRDGRVGRDQSQATPGGPGAVLGVVERDEPVDIGDKIRLADGTDVLVIGVEEQLGGSSWEQTAHVGNMPS